MTIFNTAIAASSDDAREVGAGTVSITDNFLNTGTGTGVLLGFRFTGVTIPQGATINSAKLTVRTTANDDPDLDIYGQAADDAATFTTSSYDISGRARTTAKTNWTATDVGTARLVDTPDFKGVIQEIVNRSGWSSGNALVIITISLSSATLSCRAWDQGSTPPEITIDYTPPEHAESLTFGRAMTAGATARGAASAGLTVGRGMTAGLPGGATGGNTIMLAVARALLVEDALREWWEPSGSFTPVGVYRGLGAASFADSKVNLVNPGTNNLSTPGTAPGWAKSTGWTFDGISQYFATGLASDGDYTMIVRFSDTGASDDRALIGGYGGGDNRHWGSPRWYDGKASIGYGDTFDVNVTASGWTSGVLAVSGNKLYRDGSAIKTLSGAFSGTATLVIGALNDNGTIARYFPGKIQAAAIYSGRLSDSQVAEVSAAMAALSDSPGGYAESLELLVALGIVPSAVAGGVSGLTVGRSLDASTGAIAGALDAVGLSRAEDVAPGGVAAGRDAAGLFRAVGLDVDPSAGMGDAITLAAAWALLTEDGRTVMEALMLSRALTATGAAQADAVAGLTAGLIVAMSADAAAGELAALTLRQAYGVDYAAIATAADGAGLASGRGVGVDAVSALVEAVGLAVAQGIDVADALATAADITLAANAGVAIDVQAAIGAALTLARSHDMTAGGLAEVLAAFGLERVAATSIGVSRGVADAVGLEVYRSTELGITLALAHRYVFLIDRENRIYAITRDSRKFIVDRGE